MTFKGTLISVRDMKKSKRFYRDLLGLDVTGDFGANVSLDSGIYLQTEETWKSFIGASDIGLPDNACELYFETEDIDSFAKRLEKADVPLLHGLLTHPWGQRVIRFYDPDGHIIEVGEKLESVVLGYLRSGLSPEETAQKMDVPLSFVMSSLGPR